MKREFGTVPVVMRPGGAPVKVDRNAQVQRVGYYEWKCKSFGIIHIFPF